MNIMPCGRTTGRNNDVKLTIRFTNKMACHATSCMGHQIWLVPVHGCCKKHPSSKRKKQHHY